MAHTNNKILLDRLLYTHYQHHNLATADKFLTDFGLIATERKDNIIYYRGFGENPYLYVAEQSLDNVKHFVCGGWLVRSPKDLETASQLPGASTIQQSDAPGGGQYVEVVDPNGIKLRVHHGIKLRPLDEQEKETPKPVVFNSWEHKPRKGEFQRFDGGPSNVHKLGHFGLVVDKTKFDGTVAWYLSNFSLAPTDSLTDPESGKDMMTFMHIDKGEEFSDHHVLESYSPLLQLLTSRPEFLHPVTTASCEPQLSTSLEFRGRQYGLSDTGPLPPAE